MRGGGIDPEGLLTREEFDLMKAKILGRRQIRSNWRMVATGVFRGRRGCAGRMMDGSAWLVAVLRCPVTSLGEQVALPRDERLDGLRGPAGDFLDGGGHAVIPILAMQPGHGGDLLIDVRTEPGA